MKAYRVNSNKQIPPFGEHPLDCLIANRKLADLQKEVLVELGLELQLIDNISEIPDNDECIIFHDSLYFTKMLLREFIEKSRTLAARTKFAVEPGLLTVKSIVATQDVRTCSDRIEYNLEYSPAKSLSNNPSPLIIDPDCLAEGVVMPKHMIGEPKSIVPITEKVIIQIDHWCNLWAANIGVLLANTAKIAKASKWKLLLLALKAHSTNQWKVLHKTNTIGQNCDIHPTAYIEGSIIGDSVTIGAGVVIRQSVVGDGANILNNATIDTSVIGDSSYIGSSSMIQYSVLYPGTFILARVVSLSTTGRDTFLGDNVTLTDFRLDGQNIAVMKDGILIDTGNRLLGPCIGHGVYLAAGSIVGPGREIRNELRLAPTEERTIRKCKPGVDIEGYRLIQKHIDPLH